MKFFKSKILSFVMAVVMLFVALPTSEIYAVTTFETDNDILNYVYSTAVERNAVFNTDGFINFLVYDKPENFDYENDWDNNEYWLYATDFNEELVLVITDYYWDLETTALWYEVKAADGYSLPTKMLNRHWVFQDYTDPELSIGNSLIIDYNSGGNDVIYGESSIVDASGRPVSSFDLKEDEKVFVSAKSSLESGIFSYQWQILADTQNNVWANIDGCTGDNCAISYALVGSLLDPGGRAYLRCVISDGFSSYISDVLTVTVKFNPPETDEFIMDTFSDSIDGLLLMTDDEIEPLAEDTATKSCTIVINYRYEDDTIAFDPFVATIEYGGEFEYDAESPEVVGYSPYLYIEASDEYIPADVINLDYDSLTEDVVFDVIYRPKLVNYTIRHYKQDVLDDNYEFYKQETAQEYTGTQVGDDCAIEIEGFTALYYDHLIVAADGSTIIDIYYDRNYYLVDFKMEGGFGVEPIYGRYGATVGVNDPIRHGYIFNSWELTEYGNSTPTAQQKTDYDINNSVQILIPNADLTYKAKWTTTDTTFTVVYWLEKANTEGYGYWGSRHITAHSNTVVNGDTYKDYSEIADTLDSYEKMYSYYSHADTNVTVEGDGSTVVNVYYNRNRYTLKFYYAMSSESGTGTTYYVIGGSTYRFGASATISDTGNEISLIDHYMSDYSSERGMVDELPVLNTYGQSRGYTSSYVTSTVNGTEYKYHYLSFEAKYGADISEKWPCNIFNSVTRVGKNNTNGWSGNEAFMSAWNGEHHVYYSLHAPNGNQTIKGKYEKLDYKLLWDMGSLCPTKSHSFGDSNEVSYLCFWENGANINWSVPELYRYNIYIPLLEGQSADGLTTRVYNGVTYYLLNSYDTVDDSQVSQQTDPALTGYTYISRNSETISEFDTSLYKEAYNVNFYYSRNRHQLKFYNHSEYITEKEVTLPYGTPLSNYYFDITDPALTYPSKLEPNAYQFAGWYRTPECLPGTEANLSATMPDSDVKLYAKWVPVKRTVRVYLDATKQQLLDTKVVDHGQLVDKPANEVTNGVYRFLGWFYVDSNGVEKAYIFNSIPVIQNLDIYAKWGSLVPVTYEVRYKVRRSDGTEVEIADPLYGSTLAGNNKTFLAKGGTELYAGYQEGFFPLTNSHTITMSVDGDNVFTFWYVEKQSVSYLVQYVDAETGLILHSQKLDLNNKKAVVTEQFIPITEYMPDAYQKRLVLSAEGVDANNDGVLDSNVITFYYTKDQLHAYYRIVHYVQNLALTGYEEYRSIESVGNIGNNYPAETINISGFKFNSTKTKVNGAAFAGSDVTGTLTKDGLLIELYYDRDEIDYTVKYLDINGNKVLSPQKTDKEIFGWRVTEHSINIDGYDLVSSTTQSLIISSSPERNVLTFYYQEKNVTIKYVPVTNGTASGGNVSFGSEIILASSGTANGSTPIPVRGYKFAGWYSDEDCTVAVDSLWIDESTNKLTPQKVEGLYEEKTYYAKFVATISQLVINKSYPFGADYSIDENQTFIFDIVGTDSNTSGINLTVTVHGNGQITVVDLPVGEYTVSERTSWSWRYAPDNNSYNVNLITAEGDEVTFENTRQKVYWLDGDSYRVNLFKP